MCWICYFHIAHTPGLIKKVKRIIWHLDYKMLLYWEATHICYLWVCLYIYTWTSYMMTTTTGSSLFFFLCVLRFVLSYFALLQMYINFLLYALYYCYEIVLICPYTHVHIWMHAFVYHHLIILNFLHTKTVYLVFKKRGVVLHIFFVVVWTDDHLLSVYVYGYIDVYG